MSIASQRLEVTRHRNTRGRPSNRPSRVQLEPDVPPEAMLHPMNDFATPPSTIRLGDLEVCRLGFGAMRLPGKDVWGEPDDPARARQVLRRVVELGINFIDTSWYYGPHVANRLIRETLHPYPKGLVIATKLGGKRTP